MYRYLAFKTMRFGQVLVKHAWTSDDRVLVRDHGGKAFLIQSKSKSDLRVAQFRENTQS